MKQTKLSVISTLSAAFGWGLTALAQPVAAPPPTPPAPAAAVPAAPGATTPEAAPAAPTPPAATEASAATEAPAPPAPVEAPPPSPAPADAAPVPPPAAAEPLAGTPAADTMGPNDPLAGFSGDTAYLRSADNEFVLMPGGRLQVDGYFFKRDTDKMPTPSILLRRARLELAGWVGKWFFYNLAGDFALGAPSGPDPVAQSWLATTDDFVGIAPWGTNVAMLQVGQFDAPFTLENRTSDKYFDFMERSITVRAFGIPSNKETGAMVNGLLPNKGLYYSLGLFDGDGQNFRNTDSKFDVMGRAWVAPFALAGEKSLEDVTVGGSVWLGNRGDNGLKLASQTTQGGFTFFDPAWKLASGSGVEVHQHGKLRAFALELNAPIEHKYGVRVEYVHKTQDLAVTDATAAAGGTFTPLGDAKLRGWAMYGEVYAWLVGDDKILPAPGLELQPRLKKFETKAPRHGVMLAARVDHLNETMETNATLSADKASGTRKITAIEFGANYWYSKRYRATFNYVLNLLDGTAGGVADAEKKLDGKKNEHEFLFRLAIAL
ncbi:MAG TPA: porin [Polyangiaceae bacterium]|nr:porin [Polyangiaceae bacterium]